VLPSGNVLVRRAVIAQDRAPGRLCVERIRRWASSASAIYVVDSAAGVPRAITLGPIGSWMPSWSPDGAWIYFSRGLSGAGELWKIPAAGGDAIQVTHSGAFESHPSPDR
jgi:Tol biopolymer transport system component